MSQKPRAESNDEPVGYGHPPKQHQIKPGEVRNRWGRKGKPGPSVDFLDEPFELRIDGKKIKTTRDRAIDYALLNAVTKGNVSAAKELEHRRRARALAANANNDANELAAADRAAFDRYIERHLDERACGKQKVLVKASKLIPSDEK